MRPIPGGAQSDPAALAVTREVGEVFPDQAEAYGYVVDTFLGSSQ
mgnify:CR=1 FL=1